MKSRTVLIHVGEDRRKLSESLYARIPRLLVDFLAKFVSFKVRMLLHPSVCLHDLVRISSSHQNLGYQSIRIQRNRGHKLLQLCCNCAGVCFAVTNGAGVGDSSA